MKYTPGEISVYWVVAAGYFMGDYVKLYHNSGVTDDAVDWTTEVNATEYQCLDYITNGYYPFGYQVFGHFDFGHGQSRGSIGFDNEIGFGSYRFGMFPFGHSPKSLVANFAVQTAGHWRFGLKAFDSKDNAHVGTAIEAGLRVCLLPIQPQPLEYTSYDNGASTITFAINY